MLWIGLWLACPGARAQDMPDTFRVMAWNILHGGRDIEHGLENVIGIIRAVDPDVILMVETYGSGKRIADALGYHFHLIAPEGTAPDDPAINLSLYSRFPFGDRIDTAHPFYLGGREVMIGKRKLRFFSNWFHYEPWEDEPQAIGLSAVELLELERSGKKFEMLQQVLPYLRAYAATADSIPMVFGGDMNTPSDLDWGRDTRKIHHGLVVPWYATRVLGQLGLIDSYREMHPDVLAYPGITWDTRDKKDEHRIDYIFYKGKGLRAIASESHKAFLGAPFTLEGAEFTYPSDHGFVVTTFELR